MTPYERLVQALDHKDLMAIYYAKQHKLQDQNAVKDLLRSMKVRWIR